MRDSLKKAQATYQKKCKVYPIRINKETEKDILDWMEEGRVASRIKELIREDIKRRSPKKYKMKDGALIIEKRGDDSLHAYEYYISIQDKNPRFVFGTISSLTEEELTTLYNNGYFDT